MNIKLAERAEYVRQQIKTFVANSPQNIMPAPETGIIFDEPLVQFADGSDPIFNEYKNIIGPEHLTPYEAMLQSGTCTTENIPEHISVISWILPITEATRKSNRMEKLLPSRAWAYTRWYGEMLNDAVRRHVISILTETGYPTTAPGLPDFLKSNRNEKGMYTSWSERHIAYAAGLGTFSLSDAFITERGIAHRCGSAITGMEITPSPRIATGPFANCLFYTSEKCGACIKRCPAGAITQEGHDKAKCLKYARTEIDHLNHEYNIGVAGCGLCQTGVPCEDRNPVKKVI